MDIIFVRHGETRENKKGVYGSLDTSLSQVGKKQILETKKQIEKLSFENIYISPLKRTVETAEILGVEGNFDERIKEINFGLFQGKTYEEIKKLYPEETTYWTKDYINYKMPEGESLLDLYNRTVDFLNDRIEEDKDILVVTHEGVIISALCWIFDNIEHFYRFKVKNGGITVIAVENNYKYIKGINNMF